MTNMPKDEAELERWLANSYSAGYHTRNSLIDLDMKPYYVGRIVVPKKMLDDSEIVLVTWDDEDNNRIFEVRQYTRNNEEKS